MIKNVVEVKLNRRQTYAAMTRDAILAAARKLFVHKGFDATSVEEIALEGQVSKGAVYHHFQDKQGVFAEVYRGAQTEVIAEVAASVDAAAQHETDPWQIAETATRTALRLYAADGDTRSLLQQATRVLGQVRVSGLDEELALPLISTLFEQVRAAGQFRDFDTNIAARMLFRLLCDASMWIALAPDPAVAAVETEKIVLFMAEGLRAPQR